MPRRSSFGGSRMGGSRRSSSPFRSSSYAQAPGRSYQRPPVSTGGPFSGLGSMMATGMAFGAGSEVAHQAVRGLTGNHGYGYGQPVVVEQGQVAQPVDYSSQQQQNVNKCQWESQKFLECLKTNDNNIENCQSYFDDLKACEKSANPNV